MIQVIGFGSGLLILRSLSPPEYAFYTVANTMLGTMVLLADGGISTGVMIQGSKSWQNPERLGIVLTTGFKLKKKFAIGSLFLATPALLYILRQHDASWLMSIMIVLSLIPIFLTTLSDSLLQIIPELHQKISVLQKNQVGANIGRLGMLFLTVIIFPWAFVAIFASGIPQIWANKRLYRVSAQYANLNQKADLVVEKQILTVVKKIMPGAVYYCLSGQITIWLITIFGSTLELAQIGALGRFAIIFNLFSNLFSTLIVPRFARLYKLGHNIRKYFYLSQFGIILLCIVITSISIIFSNQILWVLGNNYKGLNNELLLVAIGACVLFLYSSTHKLLIVRDIIIPPAALILISIIVQVGFAFTVRLNTITGVLLYSIYTTSFMYLIQIAYLYLKVKKDKLF